MLRIIVSVIYHQKFTIFAILISAAFSYFFYPLMNVDSMNALVSIYSILAGFLIGVISLLGDPSLIPDGSWRVAYGASKNAARSLVATKMLLYIYLFTLLLIFLHKVLFSYDGALPDDMLFREHIAGMLSTLKDYKDNVDIVILFFAILAFLFSFKLPSKLYEIQKQRVQLEVESRRQKDKAQ